MDEGTGSLSGLSEQECWRLLEQRTVGRVALAADGEAPMVLPVNYIVHEDTVLFRTSGGGVLGTAAAWGRPVAFQVDNVDEVEHAGWSVLLRGDLREAVPSQEAALAERVTPWAAGERHSVGVVVPHTITGRWLSQPRPDAG